MRDLLATAIAGVFLFASPPARAQMPDGSASRTAMQKLDFMVGRWRGEAWMVRDTERVQTTMTETIERKLGGVALLVEGLGEGGVSWSREVPGGRVRNTVKIADGEWHEVGEFPRDGTTLDADHGNEAPAGAVMNKNRLEAFSDPRPAHRTRPGEKTECVVHS